MTATTGDPTASGSAAGMAAEASPEEVEQVMKTRNYQQEMFEESLKRNIIVAVSIYPEFLGTWSNTLIDGYGIWKNTHVIHFCSRKSALLTVI